MIDALAEAINDYKGGVVLVSHDMRLISQVAKEIWIIDKGVRKFDGDIRDFKMELRKQLHLDESNAKLARSKTVSASDDNNGKLARSKTVPASDAPAPPKAHAVFPPMAPPVPQPAPLGEKADNGPEQSHAVRYIPPALRRQTDAQHTDDWEGQREPPSVQHLKGDGSW